MKVLFLSLLMVLSFMNTSAFAAEKEGLCTAGYEARAIGEKIDGVMHEESDESEEDRSVQRQ